MEYIYTALLLHKAGKELNESTIKKVLEAAGVKADEARIKALVAALDGVDIEEAVKNAAPVAAAPAASAAPVAEAPAQKKAEEKPKGKAPEEAAAGLGSLFG